MRDNYNKDYYYSLDALRGVATVAVASYHFTLNTPVHLPHVMIALDFFFILSGFVITHSYRERLERGMSASEYMVRRLVRLYPVFILALLVGSVVAIYLRPSYARLSSREIVTSLGCNAFFLPYLNSNLIFPSNGALWSLSFEMLASIAFLPLARFRAKTLLLVVTLSYGALFLYSFKLCVDGNCAQKFALLTNGGWSSNNVWAGLPRVLYGFAMGMVIYECRDGLRKSAMAGQFARIRHQQTAVCLSLLLIMVFPRGFRGVYYFAMIGSVAPLLVCLAAIATPANERSRDLARFLGRYSYPVYCLHMPFVLCLRTINDRFAMRGPSQVLAVCGGLAVTFIVSGVVTQFYDEPVRRYLSAKLRIYLQANKTVICENS